jgi:hypothetical protein
METLKDKSSVHAYHAELLGLGPSWRVVRLQLDLANREALIDVEVAADDRVECPECGKLCWISSFDETREWPLQLLTFQAVVRCRIPRTDCPEHGVLRAVTPWFRREKKDSESKGDSHELENTV